MVLTNPKSIIDEEKRYYKNLYSSNNENNLNLSSTESRFLDNPEIPKLSVTDKNDPSEKGLCTSSNQSSK